MFKMRLLKRVARLRLRIRLKKSDAQRKLGVKVLYHVKMIDYKWFRQLVRINSGYEFLNFPVHIASTVT